MTNRFASLIDLSYCSIDRPAGAGPDDGMLLVNHWLQSNMSGILIPKRCMAVVTNSEEYLKRHINSCQRTFSKTPTFILVSLNCHPYTMTVAVFFFSRIM